MKLDEIKDKIAFKKPNLEAYLAETKAKRELALELMKARKKAKLALDQICDISGLSLDTIEKMEAPYGPMPSAEALRLYAKACETAESMNFTEDGN